MAEKKEKANLKRDGFICCNLGQKLHANYLTKCGYLHVEHFMYEGAGFMLNWELRFDGHIFKGDTVDDLYKQLDQFAKTFNFEQYNLYTKDKMIIYVENIDIIDGFCMRHVTESFKPCSVTVDNYFEFRSYLSWNKKIKDIAEAEQFMDKIIKEVFIPNKYFFISPNQKTRKVLKNACKKAKDTVAKEVFPEKIHEYTRLREALYGGICYCPLPGITKQVPMMELDIKSAYIYQLLTQKFPVSKSENVDPSTWEYYLNNEYEHSLGIYRIVYSTGSTIIKCFKDYTQGRKPVNLKSGTNVEVILTLTSVDLQILLSLPRVHILDVECVYLDIYKMDYLPAYLIDTLVEEFIKKNHIDEDEDPVLYAMQKIVLNGIYGNTIRKFDLLYFSSERKHAYLAPQWGIWTTSYTKQFLLNLATKLSGWLYSDTDSIYCQYTKENLKIVAEYNKRTEEIVKEFCERTGNDFEELRLLGTFEEKERIKKFKAITQKEYLFTTDDDRIIVKAAGCNKEQMEVDDRLYSAKKMPIGDRVFGFVIDEKAECTIGDRHFVSDGYYVETHLKNDDARAMMYVLDQIEDGGEDYA